MLLKTKLAKEGYTAIKLQASTVGHFHLDLKINNTPARFILDTGASNSIIDLCFAEENNIPLKETEILGGGVGTSSLIIFELDGASLQIDHLTIEDIQLYAADFLNVKESLTKKGETVLPSGVLGADILFTYRAIIDYGTSLLFLKHP